MVQGPAGQQKLTGRQAFMKNWFAMEVRAQCDVVLSVF
jgi:hypothetical protein